MLSRVLRVALLTSVVLLAGSGLATASPSAAPGPGDQGSDWSDGAAHAAHAAGSARVRASAARTTTVNPATGPDFEMPFGCGQTWTGSSRAGHSPSYYAIDWNSPNDLGKPVLATAPGVVTTARSITGSYGRYVVIDHGNGYSSLYGHLNQIVAVVGQYVDQGDLIGYLGSTGNSTGPHLHFEERLNGAYFPPYFHRASFRINSSLTSANCIDRPAVGDWNGDGTTDLGLFRTTTGNDEFYQRAANGTYTSLRWGSSGDEAVVGDFDGDHISQVGVRREQAGTWLLRSASGAVATVTGVGTTSDQPLAGDWDGNGRAGLGVFRPSTSDFYLRSDTNTYTVIHYGTHGDRAVVGDWNGDHKTDIGVFRPSNATWYLRIPTGSTYVTRTFHWGLGTDIPITGDWDGNGTTEVGVWRPETSRFYLRSTITPTGFTAPSYAFGNHR
jgi:hypothetical protein